MKQRELSTRRKFLTDLAILAMPIIGGSTMASNISQTSQRSMDLEYVESVSFPNESNLDYLVDNETSEEVVEQSEQMIESLDRFYLRNYSEQDYEKAVEAVFAEARGLDEDYMRKVTSSIVTRSLESATPVSDIINENEQYSYLNGGDGNEVKAGNAKNIASKNLLEREAYEQAKRVVKDVFDNGLGKDELITHYFVRENKSNNFPSWYDENCLVDVVEHDGNTTRFLYLTPMEAKLKGGVFTSGI